MDRHIIAPKAKYATKNPTQSQIRSFLTNGLSFSRMLNTFNPHIRGRSFESL